MAHEISIQNGRAEIAYAGDTPWHGLGVQVDSLQSAQQMIVAAGLQWNVEKRALYASRLDGTENLIGVENYRALVRADTQQVLGIASERYQPIQNAQAADIVDALVTEGGAHVEVAGALGNGERCWMLAHIPGDFEVVKGDTVRPYFLLAWGHDGKHGVAGKLTPVRVVCNNTLTAAGLGKGSKWSKSSDIYLRHYGDVKLNIEAAQKALGIARKQVEVTQAAYQRLAQPISSQQLDAYLEGLFPRPDAADGNVDYDERLERWVAHQQQVVALYESGVGSEISGVRGTAWAAYNAVTEYTDHIYPVLKNGNVSKVRQQSVLFGSYGELKDRALEAALALVS